MKVEIGVPQIQSTLGPLLFILYINDTHRALSSVKVIHFVNDSTTYVNYDKNTDIPQVINEDLNLISNWLSNNKLFLNVIKSKYLNINKQGRPDREEYIAIHFDEKLNFVAHTYK